MNPMSVIEVAKELGVSRQYVMKTEKTALAKVRAALLRMDSLDNWKDIINNIKEKDPYQEYMEDNISI